ncbi:MAG: Ig-like domain-containing protein [Phycisphaerae bacterium]
MTAQKRAAATSAACALILVPSSLLWGMATDTPAGDKPGPTSPATAQASPKVPAGPQADKSAKEALAKGPANPPTVIEVFPALGTEEVEPYTEVRIRFDQPMNPRCTDLRWEQSFFRPTGNWRYDPARYELIFPLELKPYELQQPLVNASVNTNPNRGFKSASGKLAEPFQWTFHTRRDFDDKDAPLPRVIDIFPPSGTEVGRLIKLGIVFDQPMSPTHFHQLVVEEEGKESFGIPYYHLRYDDKENRFEMPVELPPNWSGILKFTGFRSELNRHAITFQAQYTAGSESLTQSHKEQLGQASQSRDLMVLLQDLAQFRRSLKTLSEKTRTTQYAPGEHGIFTAMRSAGAEFHLDGPQKFYADVSDMMEYPFIIASDGTTCWWYTQDNMGKQLAQLPYLHLDHINLVLCDPFSLSRIPPGHAIARLNLEFIGAEKFEGKDTFVVQAWNLNLDSPSAHPNITRWWIDANSYLVLQAIREWGSGMRVVHRFTYEQINQPIPDSQFAMPQGPDVRKRPLEALGNGYNMRYVNIGDPSSGVMSVEWGRYGSSGQKGIGIK